MQRHEEGPGVREMEEGNSVPGGWNSVYKELKMG